jgi:hypothetical protein
MDVDESAAEQALEASIHFAITHLDPTHKNFDRARRFLLVSPGSPSNF